MIGVVTAFKCMPNCGYCCTISPVTVFPHEMLILSKLAERLDVKDLTFKPGYVVTDVKGGVRRRLEIAMGLINRPAILFLDEPTLGLDAQTRAAIWEYVYRLRRQFGTTIFMTTHYLEEADQYAERIAIIDHGKILAIGTPKELKEKVGGDVITIEVNGDVNVARKVIEGIDGVSGVTVVGNTIRFKVRNGNTAAPVILESLNKLSIRATSITIKEPTMDEVFLEYTGRRLRDEESSGEEFMRFRRTISRARR